MKQNSFSPIFIVGSPRSGTTMLAVLVDRHSKIAIPPETQFFTEYVPQTTESKTSENREDMVKSALNYRRIADLHLKREEVLIKFRNYENTYPNLFRAILETYAENKPRQYQCAM